MLRRQFYIVAIFLEWQIISSWWRILLIMICLTWRTHLQLRGGLGAHFVVDFVTRSKSLSTKSTNWKRYEGVEISGLHLTMELMYWAVPSGLLWTPNPREEDSSGPSWPCKLPQGGLWFIPGAWCSLTRDIYIFCRNNYLVCLFRLPNTMEDSTRWWFGTRTSQTKLNSSLAQVPEVTACTPWRPPELLVRSHWYLVALHRLDSAT